MSISIDSRLLVFKCNRRELPPLNTKGHPERAKASSSENALIVFSANEKSHIPKTRRRLCYPFYCSTFGIYHCLWYL